MNLQPGVRPVPNSPDYQLIRKLGAGAFGEVWHAHGPGGIDVALKFIHLASHVRDAELRSLDAVKGIRHPNLVSLFGTWQKDNWLILAMEKCDRSLQDRLAEALGQNLPGIPQKELLSYMTDAANGLDALNAKQVQHRDVKPANLLLVSSGVKVADFGLAKAMEQTVASNSGAGTLAFTAPECFNGKLTQQSDQYSLAVTYYLLRTGHLLFAGDQAKVMYAHLELEPNLSRLPQSEQAVLARALSKEPGKRWANCRAFVKELIATTTQPVSRTIADLVRFRLVKASQAVLLDPNDALFYLERAEVSLEMEDYDNAKIDFDEAMRRFDDAIRVNPKNAFARLHRGRVRTNDHSGGDFDEAVRLFTEIIRTNPNDAFAYIHRGQAWLGKKWFDSFEEVEKAIEDFDEALRIDPSNAIAYFHRGQIDEAIRLDPRNPVFHAKRGEIQDLDEAIRLDPENGLYYNLRGISWYFKSEYEKAIEDFDESIRLDPKNRRAYRRLSFIWAGKKEFDQAIKNCDAAISRWPKDAFFFYQRAEAWMAKKNYGNAIKDFDETIRLSPNGYAGFALNKRGSIWLSRNEYAKAFADFDAAVRLDPRDSSLFHFYNCPYSGYRTANVIEYSFSPECFNAWKDFDEDTWLDPKTMFAHARLAWLLSTCEDEKLRDGERAITLAKQILQEGEIEVHGNSRLQTRLFRETTWKSGFELDNLLAAAHAEAGHFDEAVRYQAKALGDSACPERDRNVFRQRLELYKRRIPYRQST